MPTATKASSRKKAKGRKYEVEILAPEEVRRLIEACSRAPTGLRNRALLALIYCTGLRISEALALRPRDLDLSACTLTVHRGKGNKRRLVSVLPGALAPMEHWLETRSRLAKERRWPRTAPVFCTLEGKPVQDAYIRSNLLPRLARKAGVEKRVHAHGLRHSCASRLQRAGVSLGAIQQQLGHSHMQTTWRYLAELTNGEALEELREVDWSI